MNNTHFSIALCLCLFCFGAISSAWAQPPNDDLCDAISLTLDVPCSALNGNNTLATKEPNEPDTPNCFWQDVEISTVWYKFIAPASGAVRISTDNAITPDTADTEIALHRLNGNCSNLSSLVEINCNQDRGNGEQSIIFSDVLIGGNEYYIQVSGRSGWQGRY
ncbi:MAG: hypothetical protein AAGM67_04870, partial [Bacteroidota bacterium]